MFATKDDVREGTEMVMAELVKVKDMLVEDAAAETGRLDRVDKRSLKTQKLVNQHSVEILELKARLV